MLKHAIIGLILLLLVIGCQHDMEPLEGGSIDARQKVLIAGTISEFKQNLITRVIENLGTQNYYFKVIGLSQLAKQETEQYGAILLVSTYMAGRIDKRVRKFLQKDPINQKVIVFYTVGGEDAKPDFTKHDIRVDAVTSASSPGRVEARADELTALIKKRFNNY